MRSKIKIGARGKFIYEIEGVEVSEAEYRKVFPKRKGPVVLPQTLMETSKAWPIKSDSLGVHPKQCAEAEAFAAKVGCPTEFDKKTGQAIIRNNAHLREFNKRHGYRNRDGGYGAITG